ncbi:MAG TPA: methionine synthase [Chloroflexota bacterium]|nr:methionine synthase [Chloroflexota bacterium]
MPEPPAPARVDPPALLPTSVIGSYAWPGWLHSALAAARRGEYGPDDVQETLDDAVDLALRDQEEAGVDVVTDGEMRRAGFFTASFYGHLSGLRELPPRRLAGVAGHDQREQYEIVGEISAPQGLGLVAEYAYAARRTGRPVKCTCPGPYTLAGRLQPGAGYGSRLEVAQALGRIINAELRALVAAGATFIQLDEPSYAVHPDSPREFVELFNATVAGVGARLGVHLCFGNYVGRPVARRTYRPLFPHVLDLRADELALEFANRELAELELWRDFPSQKVLAAGLVDVKNYSVETAEDVAARVRAALRYVAPERLVVVPDCGLSQTARWASRAKLRAMVSGTALVRRELTGRLADAPARGGSTPPGHGPPGDGEPVAVR